MPKVTNLNVWVQNQDSKLIDQQMQVPLKPNILLQIEKEKQKRAEEERAKEEARNKVLDCPLCGKPLKTQAVSNGWKM